MTDRRSATAIAAAVNTGRTSAAAVAEETMARIIAYDAVQPQIWISRATRKSSSQRPAPSMRALPPEKSRRWPASRSR